VRTPPPIERQVRRAVRRARRRRAWQVSLLGLGVVVATMIPARLFLEEILGWSTERAAKLTVIGGLLLWFALEPYLARWIARRELNRRSRPAP
jgi:hypothetical protein